MAIEAGAAPETAFPHAGCAGRRRRGGARAGRQMRALLALFRSRDRRPEFPDVTPRDAKALRELKELGRLP